MSSSDGPATLTPLKRAILEIRDLRSRLEEAERTQHQPVAVVGIGLRFPGGAHDPDSFWQLLVDGTDTVGEIPRERWDLDRWYDPDPGAPGKMYTRHGAFLDQVDQFSPRFFGITPREAASMDPQQRLLLEVAWEALEHAGQAPDRLLESRTGVFVGLCNSDYFRLLARDPEQIDVYFATGNTPSVAAGRLSYLLGLQGPAIAVDTACSSSLTAVHLACRSLLAGESDLALAGGVNLILTPEININFSKSRMMAADGRCKTFDARADGYVRGEGCGIVVLKRLADALAHRDQILAVIRGSALNQDGRSNGLTAPNGPSQVAVIRQALADAAVRPDEVSYVETHGTGTSLGDPIEVQALGEAYCAERPSDRPLLLGSVKTNVGHLEAAAGVAGLIKTVLALQHGEIPPHLHFQTPSPLIAWNALPLTVPTERRPWCGFGERRLAGVSAFGFSGTNAHVILEAAPAPVENAAAVDRPGQLLVLSARTASALRTLAASYQPVLASDLASERLADICFTAAAGRAHFEHRLAVSGASGRALCDGLDAFLAGSEVPGVSTGRVSSPEPPPLAFLFTGHGAQYAMMGHELYATQPTFRAALDQCDALLRPLLDRPLTEILFAGGASGELLDQMAYAQPALFALQYALAELWRSWGVEPTVVVGHSIGEYAAACVAGLFSLEDGLRLTATRGRLLQSLPTHGTMAAIFADLERVSAAIARHGNRVTVAAINAPDNTVISGPEDAVEAVLATLADQGIEVRRLHIAQASHSPLVEPVIDELVRVAADVAFRSPRLALVSSTTGQLVTDADGELPRYWGRHLREPVRFVDAMRTVREQGCGAFVEIGPHPVLIGMTQRGGQDDLGIAVPSLRRGRGDWEQLLDSVSTLYVGGIPIDWEGFDRDYPRRRLSLPTYPWERQRHWADWVDDGPRQPGRSRDELWEGVRTAAHQQADQAPLDLALAAVPAQWATLDELAGAYVVRTLCELGVFAQAGECHTADSLMERCGIQATYRRLLGRWLAQLADDGVLTRDGAAYTCAGPLRAPAVAALEARAEERLVNAEPLLEWMKRCGAGLTAVMTGRESPLETLFPGGSYDTVDFIYHRWSVARYFNGIVRAVAESLAGGRHAGSPLRVLEIGAGTGGTTAALLPSLAHAPVLYDFTDISDFFLARARERFAGYPFVRYRLLDLERPPADQSFRPGSYDLIVAANVIHALRDLDSALDHVRSLLAPNGVLVLFEVTAHHRWLDVTTGLIEGWQRFDDAWRDDGPLMPTERWQAALQAAQFEDVVVVPKVESPAWILGHHVFVARGPAGATFVAPADDWSGESVGDGHASEAAAPLDDGQPQPTQLRHAVAEALPGERREILVDLVRTCLRLVLRLDTSQPLERDQGLMDLGVDSLMAVELRNRLTTSLGLDRTLPATLVFDFPTIDAIAGYLDGRVAPTSAAGEAPARPGLTGHEPAGDDGDDVRAARRADVSGLSEADVEALLLDKLARL